METSHKQWPTFISCKTYPHEKSGLGLSWNNKNFIDHKNKKQQTPAKIKTVPWDPWDWYIYPYLVVSYGLHVGKSTSPMDPSWECQVAIGSPNLRFGFICRAHLTRRTFQAGAGGGRGSGLCFRFGFRLGKRCVRRYHIILLQWPNYICQTEWVIYHFAISYWWFKLGFKYQKEHFEDIRVNESEQTGSFWKTHSCIC